MGRAPRAPEARSEAGADFDQTIKLMPCLPAGEQVGEGALLGPREDGRPILSAAPLRDEAGAVIGATSIAREVTTERGAYAARRAVEQKADLLLSSLPDTMVALYDAELRCTLLNGPLVDEMALDRSAYLGRRLSEFVSPEQYRTLEPAVLGALQGERSSLEYGTAPDPTYNVDIAPYREEGKITGALVVWRDITVRLEQERQQRMLATIVEQSDDAIIAKSRDGLITEWNRGAERLYGYTPAEAVGSPVSMLVPPDRQGEDLALLARALDGETVRQFETTRMRKDGRRIEVSISVSPIHDTAGEVIGASVIARDITARIEQERARREAEDRLRVTVEHAPIGVGLVSLDERGRGEVVSANARFAALVGNPDPVGSGLTLASIVHPDDAETLRGALTTLRTGSRDGTELEVRCLHGEGHIVWLLLAGAPVRAGGGTATSAVFHVIDIGDRKRFEGRLQHVADHDSLTGLYNRQRFESELERAADHADRYGRHGAVLVIDLDGFKYVNDTIGHSYGDELVRKVAGLLRGALRETDVIARIGGDEFAAILTEVDEHDGRLVAEQLLDVLRARAIVLSGHRHAKVTASIGLTTFDGATTLTAEELLVEGDIAMYEAKEGGKDQVCVYERERDARSTLATRESWLARLGTAIEHERFELLAQPIKGICSNDVARFELLLRMRTDDGDLIPPVTFLYNAERFDLVQQIDRWVFRQAVQLLSDHHAAGHDICLSVNMSGKTLNDACFLDDISAMIARCPIPRDRLIVEVTETAAIVNIEKARTVARGLRDLGCQFALDDFGAGFASFYYLKHLEFDYLKIDGEFVKSLTRNGTDQLVVKSVVDIARGLGAKTIAEFVGDGETVQRLRELGVDYGQGYHLGRPAPLDQALPALTLQSSTGT